MSARSPRELTLGSLCPPGVAVRLGSFLRLLLDGGADPNAVDEDRDTPLHYACSSGNMEIISLLLSKGADPTATDGLGRTPSERNTGANVQRLLEAESYKCQWAFRRWWLSCRGRGALCGEGRDSI